MLYQGPTDDSTIALNEYLQTLETCNSVLVPWALAHISFKTRFCAANRSQNFVTVASAVFQTLEDKYLDLKLEDNPHAPLILATAREITIDEYVAPELSEAFTQKYQMAVWGLDAILSPEYRANSPFTDVRAAKMQQG